jgi:hypothetical protein
MRYVVTSARETRGGGLWLRYRILVLAGLGPAVAIVRGQDPRAAWVEGVAVVIFQAVEAVALRLSLHTDDSTPDGATDAARAIVVTVAFEGDVPAGAERDALDTTVVPIEAALLALAAWRSSADDPWGSARVWLDLRIWLNARIP